MIHSACSEISSVLAIEADMIHQDFVSNNLFNFFRFFSVKKSHSSDRLIKRMKISKQVSTSHTRLVIFIY